jgi:hypothetical protein
MLKLNDIKKIRKFSTLLAALCIFISGFYVIGYICLKNNNVGNAVIIGKEVFTDSNLKKRVQNFVIAHVEQIKIPGIYYSKYDYIDNYLIEAMINDPKTGMPVLAIFDKNSNEISYINRNSGISYKGQMEAGYLEQKIMMNLHSNISSNYDEFHQDISPDGQKIIEPLVISDYSIGTKLYDIGLKKETAIYNEAFPMCWLPDSSGFVGLDEYLFIQSVKSVERKNLLKVNEIIGKTTEKELEMESFVLKNLIGGIDLKVSKDGQYAYISNKNASENNLTTLSIVNLKDGTFTKNSIQGIVNNMVPFYPDTLLIQGRMNGKDGVFLYNIKKNELKDIIGKEVLSFQVSPNGEKIAYTIQKDKGSDIHAAYINFDNISNDEVIYTDRNNISTVRWTRDSRRLSCLVNGVIYEFSFKNM